MICFEAPSADTVWRQAVQLLRTTSSIQESREQDTRELLHIAFTITNPRQRLVFGRPINPAFAIAEVIWIMAGANDTRFLSFWNPRMMQFTDWDKRKFHGAYGYRLGSQPLLTEDLVQQLRHESSLNRGKLDQLRAAYEALHHTSHSRQVVLQIWNSEYDMPNPKPRSKDIPCNLISHLMIRNGKLEWLQVMRSNDLIWGTPYNFIQFTTIQEIVAGWLGIDVGTYTHISDSLHVYERHWKDVETINTKSFEAPVNKADLRISPYAEWEKLWAKVVEGAVRLTKYVKADDLLEVASSLAGIPSAYAEWIALLTAEALRRRGHLAEAEKIVARAGTFWATSWLLWVNEVGSRKRITKNEE